MRVVVLTSGRLGRVRGAEDAVRRWLTAGHEVRVVTLHPIDNALWSCTEVVTLGAPATGARLGRPGKALVRVWPGSAGRQLARKVRGSSAAQAALASADVVVAAETAAVPAVWRAARRRPDVPHVVGVTAGLTVTGS